MNLMFERSIVEHFCFKTKALIIINNCPHLLFNNYFLRLYYTTNSVLDARGTEMYKIKKK